MKYAVLALVTSIAIAPLIAKGEDPKKGDIVVVPAGHSVPSLKWRLLPSLHDQRLGDAADIYNAVIKRGLKRWDDAADEPWEFDRERLRKLDAKQRKRIEDLLAANAETLADLDRVKFCDTCKWKVDFHGPRIYVNMNVDGVQDLRNHFRLASLRTRYRASQDDWRAALDSLRTQFAILLHVGEHRSLIGRLVAVAMENSAWRDLLEIVQQPNCPNIFWPIVAIPDELCDLRIVAELDAKCLLNHAPRVRDADKLDLTQAEWLKVVEEYVSGTVAYPNRSPFDDRYHRMLAVSLMLRAYTPGKAHLLRQGMAADSIERLPVGKVVAILLRDEFYNYGDDMRKWLAMPSYRLVDHYEQAQIEKIADERAHLGVTCRLQPDLLSLMMAQWNVRHRRTFVQTVEAIRAFAHENGGKLPESLSEIANLPIPLDPYTNRPLVYAKSGDVATIKADHEKVKPCFNVTPVGPLRIRIAKEKSP